MRLTRSLTAICLTFATAGTAAANCAERLDFMDDVLDQASRVVISSSSGGQGVAGAREAQALAGEDAAPGAESDLPEVDTGPQSAEVGSMENEPADETQASGHASSAEAGTRVQTLRAAVDEARAAAGQDDAACDDLLRQALIDMLTDDGVQAAPEEEDQSGQSG